MDGFKLGDRVRVNCGGAGNRFEPAPTPWEGKIGVIQDDPGDYGLRFPGESNLVYVLGEYLEALPVFFIAFSDSPRLPGTYRKEPFTQDFRAYCETRNGHWSLVYGQHQVLIVMESLRTTVLDANLLIDGSKNPGQPEVGEDVLVVIPDEPFEFWTDKMIDDADYPGYAGPKLPLPKCRFELWTRLS